MAPPTAAKLLGIGRKGLTREILREYLSYNRRTGVLTWRKRYYENAAGSVAGHHHDGYIRIGIGGKRHKAHRLIWLYVTGSCPKDQVDHIDGDGTNNRWKNLREASNTENSRNSRRHFDNKSGKKCAYFDPAKVRLQWYAQITVSGKRKYLGHFKTRDEAHAAYVGAATILFGRFASDGERQNGRN